MYRALATAVPFALVTLAVGMQPAAPPETRHSPVTDVYHGVEVTDEYRWLEDWSNPEVKAWSEAQSTFARQYLDSLPAAKPLRKRMTELLGVTLASHHAFQWIDADFANISPPSQTSSTSSSATANPDDAPGILFAIRTNPQPALVAMPGQSDPERGRVILDPQALDPSGLTSMDWYVASPNGLLVAVSLSKSGSEAGDVSVFDVRTGERVFEVVPRVNGGTAGGSLAWYPDSSGFLYTRYPRGDERPEQDRDFYTQVFAHTLGTPTEQDRYEIGKDFPRTAEIMIETRPGTPPTGTSPEPKFLAIATVQLGDSGDFMHFIRGESGEWTQLSKYEDGVKAIRFGREDDLWIISRKDAPRGKLLRLPIGKSLDSAAVVVPQGSETIVTDFADPSHWAITPSVVAMTYQTGGPSELRLFTESGQKLEPPPQLKNGAIKEVTPLRADTLLFANESAIEPLRVCAYNPGRLNELETTRLGVDFAGAPFDFVPYESRRVLGRSADGTEIPVTLVCRRDVVLNRRNPTLLTGYGGFGISIEPRFSLGSLALLEQGFVLATATLRGGGEFGETWHRSGALTQKQNVFDDFTAAARALIDAKYTSSNRLAIEGGSNGGLLMGAALTQHPDLFACVVSHVGIYDMLRVELSANGAFNTVEFGSVRDEPQFKALLKYSPYHNVKEGTTYPPVLFLTGANDPRVDPMQSRKMTAMLQRVGARAYLRTNANSGHGAGGTVDQRVERAVDVNSFLFEQLKVSPDTPAPAAPSSSP